MVSYAKTFFNYLLSREEQEEDGDEDTLYDANLAILQTQDYLKHKEFETDISNESLETDKDNKCFQKTGVISYIDTEQKYVLIDGEHHFDMTSCSLELHHHDKVLYLGYYKQDNKVVIVKILENEGNYWGSEEVGEEKIFQQTEHTLVGQVARREGRDIFMANGDIKFNLDEVDASFVPIEGDLLEMSCKVISNENNGREEKSTSITSAQVVGVIGFRPLGLKVSAGTVSDWNGEYGLCDRKIYFNKHCMPLGMEVKVGTKVMMKIIESYQEKYNYRAIQIQLMYEEAPCDIVEADDDDEESMLQLESDKKLEISHNLTFDSLEMDQKAQISLKVTNKNDRMYIINKWVVLSKKRDSQITITPVLDQPYHLFPQQTITFTICCRPKFLGKAKEQMVIIFRGFHVKRAIKINVVGKQLMSTNNNGNFFMGKQSLSEQYSRMKSIRSYKNAFISGRKLQRPPNFVVVRIGLFTVPDRIWNIFLGDSEQCAVEYDYILVKMYDIFPFLTQDLTVYNYLDKWHTLLYLEEVQNSINLRKYDMPKAYLIKCQEYLSLEVKGLSEKKPSLVIGDRVAVKDVYDKNAPKYEGFIHEIRGSCILLKFNPGFHEEYSGTDVSVEFYISRMNFRRSHHAVNLAISNLGSEVLFPRQLTLRPHQLSLESIDSIEWFNVNLNSWQKAAITNILLGECRPKPYCIYGPPGTGKTVTVVETILQILKHFPQSRILVATPSNSAANIITERLIDYKDKNPYSIVRIIAHYLAKSDNIPPKIKSYCVTVDITQEGSSGSNHYVLDGVNLNCQSSFIGRHRVTIGTCNGLGALCNMGFPKGHFTHVIVDEAGQAIEPEIMVPLTLSDKDNGQFILAGDPQQLGPVIMSRFCSESGMSESYLSRLLETVPYQKDFTSFRNGFNEKLITKLNDNYRSLKEVLSLPSKMFYDGSLVERLDRNQPWIERAINAISDIFETGDSKTGGIYVHGIRGCNARSDDSPSWYNPQEATMVALTASKMFKRNIAVDDIGIITPYIAQTKHIRALFDGMGLPVPKIGTVEEFQGQEKPIIIISTVRSTESFVPEDIKHTLGFVKNAKRLNVAITRAQVAVILFCDPHLLCTDPLWGKIVKQAVEEDKYMGCDLPKISILK